MKTVGTTEHDEKTADSSRMKPIPVVQMTLRDGSVPAVVGVIDAATLSESFVIPRRDPRKKTGYQRDPSTTRVNRLAKDLNAGRVDLPTALLLNIRNCSPKSVVAVVDQTAFFSPAGKELHVVDGQHRVLALEKLVSMDPDRWSGFTIPFVCLLGASEREEMRQFYVVNSTAKSVRTDLAYDLLRQQAEADPELMVGLVERGEDWKVRGQALVEAMTAISTWRHRVQLPRDPKARATITSSSLAGSLRPLLSTPYFGSLPVESQVRILDAYWRGVRGVLPECFSEPTRYALQKSVGAYVMHSLLVTVLEYVRSKGDSVIEPESFVLVLHEALLELEGDTAGGEPAKGSGFWLAGAAGAAGSFSSSAGQKVLLARLKGMLPVMPAE